ncbi:hypothetical protein ACFQL7_07055 [Halocatena marina]|uniref:Uncharacterized protein n=1 Tax=Halocatena marina TaxID=2934937 RepID=A0ABD5YK77_9EURY
MGRLPTHSRASRHRVRTPRQDPPLLPDVDVRTGWFESRFIQRCNNLCGIYLLQTARKLHSIVARISYSVEDFE